VEITLPQFPLPNDFVVDVKCGAHHSIIRTNNGVLYGWGESSQGQLGVGRRKIQHTPFLISRDFGSDYQPPRSTSTTTFSHLLHFTEIENYETGGADPSSYVPLPPFTQYGCGTDHTIGAARDTKNNNNEVRLFVCGKNTEHQIGLGERAVTYNFVPISKNRDETNGIDTFCQTVEEVIEISGGEAHTFILTKLKKKNS